MTSPNTTAPRPDSGWAPDLRSPLVIALALLLGLQLFLALGLSLRAPGMAALTAQTPLLDFAPDDVTAIRIEGADGGVTLRRAPEETWVLADLADFPVAPSRVDPLLAQLADLKRPLPIATSEEARKRFKLADDGFERRLTLEGKDGPLATLLLGDSPGFRRLFARPADDPGVYELSLALSDLSARRDDWLDTGLLRLDRERIARIASQDWALVKDGDVWRLENSEQPVDQSTANALVTRLANLGYRGVLGTEDAPAYRQQAPKLVLDLGLTDGTARSYRISQAENSEDYVLKDVEKPYFFKLSAFDLDGVLDLDPAKLTLKPASPDTSSADTPPPSAPTVETEQP
ncbi:DUF4340 domain-containing protein [Thiocystis violascens]|uniref:DUF4340 domain-containing protein n=1 Tax=Thiocystis violascens (strain ATCC 17096 / DSM 198 / 6111) TaxID=765911 RepID=I3Y6T7_THIV6|nr:DUF4340 domain-containing protein [Thiocystis violascens]AFL72705.1 hypothetical protein Thivi_0651 [Thiocystis violascens DSM 198]